MLRFLPEDEMVRLLSNQQDVDEHATRSLLVQVLQVRGQDYNPPTRERLLEWQAQQDFPICPTPDDPNSCNVYRELRFPQDIYDSIGEFWAQVADRDTDTDDVGEQAPQRGAGA